MESRFSSDKPDRDKKYTGKSYSRSGPNERREEPDGMVYGIQSVLETLRSGQEIDRLYVLKGLSNPDVQQLAFERKLTIQRVPPEKLDRLTRKNHQGVICFISAIRYVKLSNVIADVFERGVTPFFLLVDRVTDVRNFGAIARTAECAGVQTIVVPGRKSALINADAMKTSSGALNYLSVCREYDLADTVHYLKESGIRVVAVTEKGHRHLYAADLTGPIALIMGSEEDGISPELIDMADDSVKIPLMGEVGSLNVSVATGVVLYEAVRQRQAVVPDVIRAL
jgi:23S rRNA (guanosine2251-2'-O)-methyltransferase